MSVEGGAEDVTTSGSDVDGTVDGRAKRDGYHGKSHFTK